MTYLALYLWLSGALLLRLNGEPWIWAITWPVSHPFTEIVNRYQDWRAGI